MVPVPSGDLLIFNIERSYAAGPVPRDALARLDSLRPHLARAALVSARLRLERARTTVDVLERVGLPAAAVQQDGRVLAANALLERLDGHFVFTARDRLRISNPSANALFDQALTHVASPSANELVVGSIPVPAVEGSPPLVIHLVPVRGAGYDVFSAAVTVLIVTPVTGSEAPSTALLSGLFDLTASESRLAAVIATGVPPREAAAKLGISEQTARTTLKRVFMKVGVSRQSELAAL